MCPYKGDEAAAGTRRPRPPVPRPTAHPKGFGRSSRSGAVSVPAWLVDEMLGRLARYLRFVGCDTAYVRGASDDELLELAGREHRVLLTRDRLLSRRCPSGFLLESPVLAEQWRAVRAAWPALPTEVSFLRCTLCNGPLRERAVDVALSADPGLPPPVRSGSAALFACRDCGHLYWEGSHTAKIRERIAAWEREELR